jgi:hypothetical protein
MFSRLLPSRDARIEIQRFAANQPQASDIPWYGISQRERILRWLFSRPPRVQTLLSVRAALAQRYDDSDCGNSADSWAGSRASIGSDSTGGVPGPVNNRVP